MAKKARNADYTREYNRKEVLRILRRGAMSRAELARATGLTRAATSLIADDLLSEGVLQELAPQITGRGRSAIPLTVRGDRYYALAVRLNRRDCVVGLCDFAGNLLRQQEVEVRDDFIQPIIAALEELAGSVERERVLGIGISAPGPVDTGRGQILNPPRFAKWHGVELATLLSQSMDMPAYLENDACALALHQMELGGSRDFLLLLVDGGVGSGVITRGKLLGGAGNFTCELGHTTICYDGRQCECGNRGCLEAYASTTNLLRDSKYSSWRELVADVGKDPEAERLIALEASYLSAGVINMLNLMQLDTVYLAGELRYGFEHLAWRIQNEVNTRALSRSGGPAQIKAADMRPEASVLAAGEVVVSHFLTV